MLEQISIALCPSSSVVAEVKELKDLLREQIGWYPSCNAAAHITFVGFLSEEKNLVKWEKDLKHFCEHVLAFEVCFNQIHVLKGGTLCILPDEESKERLIILMKAFKQYFKIQSNTFPHITIGRQLSKVTLMGIEDFWLNKKVSLRFSCQSLSIRKLDLKWRQYNIHETIPFGSVT
jgi:2'-5' RNA ligase